MCDINPIFTVSGLGQLVDAAIQADKLVTFWSLSEKIFVHHVQITENHQFSGKL